MHNFGLMHKSKSGNDLRKFPLSLLTNDIKPFLFTHFQKNGAFMLSLSINCNTMLLFNLGRPGSIVELLFEHVNGKELAVKLKLMVFNAFFTYL